MCVCVFVCFCVHGVHVCVYRDQRQPRLLLPRSHLLVIFKTDSFIGVWDLQIRLDWMVSELQRPSCLYKNAPPWLDFYGVTRDWTHIEFILTCAASTLSSYTISTFLDFKVIVSFLDYTDIDFVPCPIPTFIFYAEKNFWDGVVRCNL